MQEEISETLEWNSHKVYKTYMDTSTVAKYYGS